MTSEGLYTTVGLHKCVVFTVNHESCFGLSNDWNYIFLNHGNLVNILFVKNGKKIYDFKGSFVLFL